MGHAKQIFHEKYTAAFKFFIDIIENSLMENHARITDKI